MRIRCPRLPRLAVGSVLLVVVPAKNQPIATGDKTTPDLVPPRTINATVIDLKPGTKQGLMLVNVEVTTADALPSPHWRQMNASSLP